MCLKLSQVGLGSKACGCAADACHVWRWHLKFLRFDKLHYVMLCYATITLCYATFCSSIKFTIATPRPFKMKATQAEPVFVNVYGAQESIPRNRFRQPLKPAGPVRQIGLSYRPTGWESISRLLKRFTNTSSRSNSGTQIFSPDNRLQNLEKF